jgi:hypothetical protein
MLVFGSVTCISMVQKLVSSSFKLFILTVLKSLLVEKKLSINME